VYIKEGVPMMTVYIENQEEKRFELSLRGFTKVSESMLCGYGGLNPRTEDVSALYRFLGDAEFVMRPFDSSFRGGFAMSFEYIDRSDFDENSHILVCESGTHLLVAV
jgi:hypothetical protein